MASNTAYNESGEGASRRAATASRASLTERLAVVGARLFCLNRRNRVHSGTEPAAEAEVSWRDQQHVLRDYHAANLVTARAVSEELVRAGFNTGDVPYGYRAQRVRVQPPDRRPRWRTRLVIEPVEASTVRLIFLWRGKYQLPAQEIRRRLTDSRYPAPIDPDTGRRGVWTAATVRAILRNPKYLGRQVWGRTRHGKRAPRAAWVWSDVWVHPPLVTVEEFTTANRYSWLIATPPGDHDAPPQAV